MLTEITNRRQNMLRLIESQVFGFCRVEPRLLDMSLSPIKINFQDPKIHPYGVLEMNNLLPHVADFKMFITEKQ